MRELPLLGSLRMVVLIDVKVPDEEFQVLSHCPGIEHLTIFYSKKLVDMKFLAGLRRLQTLHILNAPKLDYATLPELATLRELVIEGGVHVALNLPSLSPLGKLTGLRRLELPNVMSSDSSLEPLAKLRSLEHLFLSARAFEVEEYARLAVALPGAKGRCLEPSWVPGKSPGSYTFPCPRCGQAQAFLNGKGMRRSCPECKAPYIEKHRARWEAGMRSSW